jgi:hypothetical protein
MHKRTFISAMNNRAVLSVREKNTAGAVAFLKEVSEISKETPLVVYHNATVLLNSGLDLRTARKILVRVLASNQPEGQGGGLPNHLMYSLDYDAFDAKDTGKAIPVPVRVDCPHFLYQGL